MRHKRLLTAAILLAIGGSFLLVARQASGSAMHAATTPSWPLLGGAFGLSIAIQLLRALAWSRTLRGQVGFRAVFAASAIGSFVDVVLPARLGEASKVGVLKVAAEKRWPGLPAAGGSLLCAHLLEAITFSLVGAVSALFLPLPGWTRWGLLAACLAAGAGLALAAALHKRFGHRLPRALDCFLGAAVVPKRVLAQAGGILLGTWSLRWFSSLIVLHAVGIHVSAGGALLFMVLTGLANMAPLLPGNAGVYQGAAVGALALIGHVGAKAVAVSVVAPALGAVGTAAAAMLALSFFGRRFAAVGRAAIVRR